MGFYRSQWEPNSADHHAPLSKRPSYLSERYADFAVQRWISNGISPEKIVLGLPLYGRSWTLSTNKTIPPAPAAGPGAPGKWTEDAGLLAYYEICDAVRNGGWNVVKDPSQTMGPYALSPHHPRTWVAYDDPAMAIVKTQYVRNKSLGGVMVWDLSYDDFHNTCGNGYNPILTSIYNTLKNSWPDITTRTTEVIRKQNKEVTQTFFNTSIVMSYATEQEIFHGNCECVCD